MPAYDLTVHELQKFAQMAEDAREYPLSKASAVMTGKKQLAGDKPYHMPYDGADSQLRG